MSLRLNHPQFAKEARPLVLPWIVAVTAGSLLAARPLVESDGVEGILTAVAVYGFFGGLALLAAICFGSEFQERTLPLLLTQPLARVRIWNQKMGITTLAVTSAALVVAGLLGVFSGWYSGNQIEEAVRSALNGEEMVLAALFVLGTICSCGYWTLLARSTIGGLVFTTAAEFITGLSVALICATIRGHERPFEDRFSFSAVAVSALLYSGLFLWLGRRKFARLEVKTQGTGTIAAQSQPSPGLSLLTSCSSSPGLNLFKKELRLQKPVAQLAVVFVACWLCTLLAQRLWPSRSILFLLDVLVCLYAPISSLLAGCVPAGEEKALGLTAGQRALPFAAGLQWAIQLFAGFATAVALGFGLPVLLFWATGQVSDLSGSDLWNSRDSALPGLACVSAVSFLFGYWAISLVSSSVKAALVAVAMVIAAGACLALGIWCGTHSGGWERGPFVWIMILFHLPPDFLMARLECHPIIDLAGWVLAAVMACLMLWQSCTQFHRSEARENKLPVYSLVLLLAVFLAAFWYLDLQTSLKAMRYSRPVLELQNAVGTLLSHEPTLARGRTRRLSLETIDNQLSSATKFWLRDAEISYSSVPGVEVRVLGKTPKPSRTLYEILIVFPGGKDYRLLSEPWSGNVFGRWE